jgi:sporulation protein YlmC with PRC-barrel domain
VQIIFVSGADRFARWHSKKRSIAMATLNDPSETHGRLIAASQVNGTTVYNRAGEKLGSIYDVMLAKGSGKAEYTVMSFGGFLGIGDRYHPLPWDALTYDPVQGDYVVDFDRSRLEGAPSYGAGETCLWENPTYGRRVTDYYDCPNP